MAFQSTIYLQQGAGVVGDRASDTPWIVKPYMLTSADAANNVIGRGFSISAEGVARAGNTGSNTLPFAGILVNSKAYASFGTAAGGPLAPTLTLANYVTAEFATMGTYFITLGDVAAIGDLIVYDNTTGVLTSIAPTANLPVGTSFAYAKVVDRTVAGAGLAVIEIDPTLPIPVLA